MTKYYVVSLRSLGYLHSGTAWSNFEDYVWHNKKDHIEELRKYNAKICGFGKYVFFDSEEDFIVFKLKWA